MTTATPDRLFTIAADRPAQGGPVCILSARVGQQLYDDVVAAVQPGEDKSAAIRRLLRAGLHVNASPPVAQDLDDASRRSPTHLRDLTTVVAGTAPHRILTDFAVGDLGTDLAGLGFTADDIARRNRSIRGVGQRVAELHQGGLIAPTGDRRPTRHGHPAAAYRITTAGHHALRHAKPARRAQAAHMPSLQRTPYGLARGGPVTAQAYGPDGFYAAAPIPTRACPLRHADCPLSGDPRHAMP